MTLIQRSSDTQTEIALLKKAFPFFFLLDKELRVTEWGPSLAKVAPHIVEGSPFANNMRIEKPIVSPLTIEGVISKQENTVLISVLQLDITLRGQFLATHDGLIFIGSLWNCLELALEVFDLSLDDFAPHDANPENWFITQTRDIQLKELTELIAKLDELAEERKQLALAEKELARDLDAAADLHVRFAEDRTIVEAHATNQSFLPRRADSLIGSNVDEVFDSIAEEIAAAVATADSEGIGAFEYECRDSNTDYFLDARVAKTRSGEYLLLSRDISTRRRMELELRHKASHDALTGLPNRRQLEERMTSSIAENKPLALLLIDLDDFKLVNDSFGHYVGDCLLIELGNRLRRLLNNNAHPARLGGDEFAIVVEDYGSKAELIELANHVAERISKPFHHQGKRTKSACSIGIAVHENDISSETLLRNADIAMYEAKSNRNADVAIFNNAMHESLLRTMEVRSELELAIKERALINFYQPIIDLQTGKIAAVEALVRWPHPTRGLLTPFHFIEIAEKNGLIIGLGDLVLETACAEIARLNASIRTPIKIHVNASPIQFEQADMVEKTLEVLASSSMPAEQLSIEITESLLINDFDQALKIVRSLGEAGVGISLDDFGVGYSSLAYLEHFPIDKLKLDRSFMQKLDSGESRPAKLVSSIISLAKAIDLNVIAEGVETQEHHQAMIEFNCEYAQGYLYGRPMPFSELPNFLENFICPAGEKGSGAFLGE